ncbi:ATP-binding cassette domain-containing protein [Jiangella ureilytica]|uniref:ATP-binding cassette domain-containing protein n=1 Tax=Jiangella ureilytica TaxID=2530374 RepID=A0A4R4S4Z3_9ACTN|nr:ATP-binding cassette domain-containing protein [Jiangella ureilytica]TDC56632.1 ATP-binding cassette domain-containing protein [Jiangella ureilytica]
MITAQGLYKRYGAKVAVDHLSFEVRPGMVTGFLGPNGAGKSTTMRLMLDLDNGGGETLFDGRRFGTIRHPMREIGAVLESKAFHPTRTARNHLRMLAAGSGIPFSRADEVLEFVGLTDVRNKKPKGFSLGMAQRLGLAQALLGDPQTLILDEPANGLDPSGIHWLRTVLKSLADQGRTIFVSSHLLSEMALMADQLVVIGRGTMIYNGDVDGFVRNFTQASVVVRSPQAAQLAELLRRVDGATVEELTENVRHGVAAAVAAAADGADAAVADAAVAEDAVRAAGSALSPGLRVSGMETAAVGELAFQNGILLHELATQTASLEAAFMTATGESVEYRAHDLDEAPPGGPQDGPPAAPPVPPSQPGGPTPGGAA